MLSAASLWLPILLSAVLVFIASSVIHKLPLWHRADLAALPREADLANALRALNVPPGDYILPWCTHRQMRSEEFRHKLAQGPVVLMTVLPNGPVVMGRRLALWFVYLVVVAAFVACLGAQALPAGTPYPRVFRFVLVSGFLGYALALLQNSIWLSRSWLTTFKGLFDGLIYAALTAGTFGWLWPHGP